MDANSYQPDPIFFSPDSRRRFPRDLAQEWIRAIAGAGAISYDHASAKISRNADRRARQRQECEHNLKRATKPAEGKITQLETEEPLITIQSNSDFQRPFSHLAHCTKRATPGITSILPSLQHQPARYSKSTITTWPISLPPPLCRQVFPTPHRHDKI